MGRLLLNLLVLNRKSHEVKRREALAWGTFWIALLLAFIGGKILLEEVLPRSMPLSLGIVGLIRVLSVVAALLWPKREE